MPIILNTAPINVKDSNGEYVSLNSFSANPVSRIKLQEETSIANLNATKIDILSTIETAIDNGEEKIEAAGNAAVADGEAAINNAKEAAIGAINSAASLEVPKMLVLNNIIYSGESITKYASEITENMYVISYSVNRPSAIADLEITCGNGSITISGSGDLLKNNNSVMLTLYLYPGQVITLNDVPSAQETES